MAKNLTQARNERYLINVGAITVLWAKTELALDWSNEIIMDHAGGNSLESALPVSIGPKIKFFRKGHAQLALLADFRGDGLALAYRLTKLKEKRHDVIHGNATRALMDNPDYTIHRARFRGPTMSLTATRSSLPEIESLARDIVSLAHNIIDHTWKLGRRFKPEDRRYKPRS